MFHLQYVHSLVKRLIEITNDESQDDRYETIQQQCKDDGVLFEDEEFPTSEESLLTTHGQFEKDEIVWLRPKEIVQASKNDDCEKFAEFIHDKPTRFDVIQGDLGNCWFLASMANLPTHEAVFERVVPSDNVEFENEDYCGAFHFRFWQYGNWVDIVIDDRLPTFEGKLIFAYSEYDNVFWSALLEKACAKLHKSYKALDSGWMAESFEDFTGGISEVFSLQNENEDEISPEELFQHIQSSMEQGSLCGVAIASGDKQILNERGLFPGHAYSLTAATILSTGTWLVRIRNPWGGEKEWNGPWGDAFETWDEIGEEEREDLELTFDADGEFWLSWEDCLKHFTQIEIGHFNPSCISSENHENVELLYSHMSTLGTSAKNDPTQENSDEVGEHISEDDADARKGPQFMTVSVTTPENSEEGQTFQLMMSIILKNRRTTKVLAASDLHFQFYSIADEEAGMTQTPDEEFFEDKDPLDYKKTCNFSNEFLIRCEVAAGEYCAVVMSDAGENYFVRAFSQANVQIRPILNQNEE